MFTHFVRHDPTVPAEGTGGERPRGIVKTSMATFVLIHDAGDSGWY